MIAVPWTSRLSGHQQRRNYHKVSTVVGHGRIAYSPRGATRRSSAEHGGFRRGNGPETRNERVHLDIVPDRRIVMAYTMAFNGKNISASLGTVEFEAIGAGTRLIYTEPGSFFDGADGPSSRKQGWRSNTSDLLLNGWRCAETRTRQVRR